MINKVTSFGRFFKNKLEFETSQKTDIRTLKVFVCKNMQFEQLKIV